MEIKEGMKGNEKGLSYETAGGILFIRRHYLQLFFPFYFVMLESVTAEGSYNNVS